MQFFSSSHSFNWVDLEYETDSEPEDSDNSVAYKLLSVKPKYPNILDVKADAQQCTTTYISSVLLWFNEQEVSDNYRYQINIIKQSINDNQQASKCKHILFSYLFNNFELFPNAFLPLDK